MKNSNEQIPTADERLHCILSRPGSAECSPHELFGADDDDFWFWLNTEGCRRSEELRQLLPSMPDEQTQARTIGSAGDAALREGFNAYRLFKQIFQSHRGALTPDRRVLDFGCGWGRIIRFFLKDLPATQLVGSDYAPHLLEICRTTNRWCDFVQTPASPPCGLPADGFDMIYLYSVFSHLSEDQQRAWRAEFHRLLKPGGLLVATTWDREFIERCRALRDDPSLPCENNWRKELATVFVETERHLDDYDSGRFAYSPYSREIAPWSYAGDVSLYGEACVSRRYVAEQWADLFEIVDFIQDRAVCPQNVIVVRKRNSSR
ncbi:MAG: class I SAM-dependent methyltransferase [Vicinamibacterales bacterium]